MAKGYYTAAEWADVMRQLDEISDAAANQGRTELLIDMRLLRSMVHSDMRKEYEQARAVLEAAKRHKHNLVLLGHLLDIGPLEFVQLHR